MGDRARRLDAGLGLLPWSPLGGGWLSGKYRRDQRPSGDTRLGDDPNRGMEAYDRRGTERTWNVIDAVQKVAEDRGVSMAEVALAWVTARPAVTSTILGARTLEQLEANLRSAELRADRGGDRRAGRRQLSAGRRLPLRRARRGPALQDATWRLSASDQLAAPRRQAGTSVRRMMSLVRARLSGVRDTGLLALGGHR